MPFTFVHSLFSIPPLFCHHPPCMFNHSCHDPSIISRLGLASASSFLLPPHTPLQISVVNPLQLDMDTPPCTLPEPWHSSELHSHSPCICVCVDVTPSLHLAWEQAQRLKQGLYKVGRASGRERVSSPVYVWVRSTSVAR